MDQVDRSDQKLPALTTRVSFPSLPPSPRHPSASDHLSFSPTVPPNAQFLASFHDAGNFPRRRSIGEDDSLLARDRTSHWRGIARSARHNSVDQLEFRPLPSFIDPRSELHVVGPQPLGHLIPFSRRSYRRGSRNLEPATERSPRRRSRAGAPAAEEEERAGKRTR